MRWPLHHKGCSVARVVVASEFVVLRHVTGVNRGLDSSGRTAFTCAPICGESGADAKRESGEEVTPR